MPRLRWESASPAHRFPDDGELLQGLCHEPWGLYGAFYKALGLTVVGLPMLAFMLCSPLVSPESTLCSLMLVRGEWWLCLWPKVTPVVR